MVLIGLLDGEGGFCLLAPAVAQPPQFGGAPHLAVHDMSVDQAAVFGHPAGIVLDEGVGHRVRKAHAATVLVQPQEVVAELIGLRRPQPACYAFAGFEIAIAHDPIS